jgi:hypothetical protein
VRFHSRTSGAAGAAPHCAQLPSERRWSLPQYVQRQFGPPVVTRNRAGSVTVGATELSVGISYCSDASLGLPHCWHTA